MSEASRDPCHSSGSTWQVHTDKRAYKNSTPGFQVQSSLIRRIPGEGVRTDQKAIVELKACRRVPWKSGLCVCWESSCQTLGELEPRGKGAVDSHMQMSPGAGVAFLAGASPTPVTLGFRMLV